MTNKVFTVSEVLRDAKTNLETLYPDLWMEGEISNLNRHSSGHCYFTMKDAGGQISAAMFRDDFRRVKFNLEDGLQVIVRGRVTLYPPQGRFQIIVSQIEPKGKGGLQLAFEQLKAKLMKEGLFDEARKKPIPELPQWIAVITSPDGAALHDILNVLDRRTAGLRILICPVKVQGAGAAEEIAEAIGLLNRSFPELEVLMVGRGGGSLEDLWAFNEEVVARAIAASQIPVISCVGHETDFTIADFVADLRAPTPSAAAELVSKGRIELGEKVAYSFSRLRSQITFKLEELTQCVAQASSNRMLRRPTALIEEYSQEVDAMLERLRLSAQNRQEHRQKDLQHLLEKLHLLSPLATLSRGYAIAWKQPEHEVIKSARKIKESDTIEVQLHEGRIYAQVQRTEI
jgi:exodeoxyribonuclease VII large subunit